MVSKEVIQKAKKGDTDAFREIYSEFKDFVWNIALKTAGNRTMAEDAASLIFIRVFKKMKKFKFKSSFKTWLYRVAVNTTINYIKKENNSETLQLNTDYKDDLYDAHKFQKELSNKDLVKTILNRLPANQRMLVTLREFQGMSYEEISKYMNISMSSVKVGIYRAREKMRKIYRELMKENEMQQI
ncbi:MAG: RNA polymerase sigma factor [Elusimicrobiota bacterium]